MRRLAVLLALAAMSAGCTFPEAEPAARPAHAPALAPARPDAPPPEFGALPRLDVALHVEDRWVRPGDRLNASAESPHATSHEWYLASRNPVRRGPEPPRGTASPAAPLAFRLAEEGRHAFVSEGARLGVTVVPDAAPLQVVVRVVGEGPEARFVPDDAFTGVGATLVVERPGGDDVEVRAEGAMLPVGRGPRLSFEMPASVELGDYDLVVVARAGGDAWGEAAARVIHDKRKPDALASWTHRGAVALPPLADAPTRHAWESPFPIRALRATLSLESDLPIAPAARVALVDAEGREVAATGAGALVAADLPAGPYAFLVRVEEGASVSYRIDVEAERVLVPPETFFNS